MDATHLIPMIYEFSIGFVCLILVINIGKKYIERRKPVIKYLFLFCLMLTFAVLTAAVSRILRLTELWIIIPDDPLTPLVDETTKLELLAITVSFIAIGDLFLAIFILEVFYNGAFSKKNKKYIYIYIILSSASTIYSISTGILVEDLTDAIWGVVILISAPLYILLMRSSFKLSRKVNDPLSKLSMKIMGMGGLSILLVFVFFLLDAMMGGKYSPFYYIAWSFAMLSISFLYISVLQPGWFKRIFETPETEST
ncbi:MAG: hypothetical protein ACTSRZ_07945 [Promethearchaeota archaeon]